MAGSMCEQVDVISTDKSPLAEKDYEPFCETARGYEQSQASRMVSESVKMCH